MMSRVTVATLEGKLAKQDDVLLRTEADLKETIDRGVAASQEVTQLQKRNKELGAIAKDAEEAVALIKYQRDALIGFVESRRADRDVERDKDGHVVQTHLDRFLSDCGQPHFDRHQAELDLDLRPGEWMPVQSRQR